MNERVPTWEEYLAYKGAHTHKLWRSKGDDWVCPGCARTKFQILRWTVRFPRTEAAFEGWVAPLHNHHDHSQESLFSTAARFPLTTICDQCNVADGKAKQKLKLPKNFSFSPREIALFVQATPHASHTIIYAKAQDLFDEVIATLDRSIS